MSTSKRPRRSLLFMPGSNARALEKAKTLPADGLIIDLEDAVAPAAKVAARQQVAETVTASGFPAYSESLRLGCHLLRAFEQRQIWPTFSPNKSVPR